MDNDREIRARLASDWLAVKDMVDSRDIYPDLEHAVRNKLQLIQTLEDNAREDREVIDSLRKAIQLLEKDQEVLTNQVEAVQAEYAQLNNAGTIVIGAVVQQHEMDLAALRTKIQQLRTLRKLDQRKAKDQIQHLREQLHHALTELDQAQPRPLYESSTLLVQHMRDRRHLLCPGLLDHLFLELSELATETSKL